MKRREAGSVYVLKGQRMAKKTKDAPTPVGAYETITPDMAKDFLVRNHSNRNVIKSRVAEYAEAMRTGKWRTTHEGIAIGAEGVLYDGQHRLKAIVEANVPIVLHVMRGLSPESRQVIDTGRSRSASDNIAIVEGVHLHRTQAAALNVIWMATIAKSVARNANADEVRETLLKHLAGYEAMKHALGTSKRGLTRAGFTAAFIYAYPTSAEKITFAVRKFMDGAGLSKVDPMYVLREYALSTGEGGARGVRTRLSPRPQSAPLRTGGRDTRSGDHALQLPDRNIRRVSLLLQGP